MVTNPFSDLERDLWAPPEQLTTTEWADRYRHLSAKVSAVPGRYRSSRVPYAAGIMDALSDKEHREVYVMKPVQSGGSELGRNWLGRSIDLDPGPVMIVFPSQDSCRENMEERIVPMFEDTPRLRSLLTGRPWDVKKGVIHLRSCSIYTGWSGSPQALASRARGALAGSQGPAGSIDRFATCFWTRSTSMRAGAASRPTRSAWPRTGRLPSGTGARSTP